MVVESKKFTLLETFQKNLSFEIYRPVWFMRQAGRYLPSYMAIKKSFNSFYDMCYNPTIVSKISFLPIEEFDLDGIILFSDILVLLDSLGFDTFLNNGRLYRKPFTLESCSELLKSSEDVINKGIEYLEPVFESLRVIVKNNMGFKTILGFSGCPFTILCYAVSYKNKGNFSETTVFLNKNRSIFEKLIVFFQNYIVEYLCKQIESGAQVVQLFESHSSLLSFSDFEQFVVKPVAFIAECVKKEHPNAKIILFCKGAGLHYKKIVNIKNIDCVSFDYHISPEEMLNLYNSCDKKSFFQGNLDPYLLCYDLDRAKKYVKKILKLFGSKRFIFNLGHGILRETPVSNVKELVCFIKNINIQEL